jgi:hypothetical protein
MPSHCQDSASGSVSAIDGIWWVSYLQFLQAAFTASSVDGASPGSSRLQWMIALQRVQDRGFSRRRRLRRQRSSDSKHWRRHDWQWSKQKRGTKSCNKRRRMRDGGASESRTDLSVWIQRHSGSARSWSELVHMFPKSSKTNKQAEGANGSDKNRAGASRVATAHRS